MARRNAVFRRRSNLSSGDYWIPGLAPLQGARPEWRGKPTLRPPHSLRRRAHRRARLARRRCRMELALFRYFAPVRFIAALAALITSAGIA